MVGDMNMNNIFRAINKEEHAALILNQAVCAPFHNPT